VNGEEKEEKKKREESRPRFGVVEEVVVMGKSVVRQAGGR
jgi:hypothetical protein